MTKAHVQAIVFALGPLSIVTGCSSGGAANSVESTCARISGCGLDGSMSIGFGMCQMAFTAIRSAPQPAASRWQRDYALIDCVFAANSCDEMQACLQPTAAQAALCDAATTDVCSDNTLVTCSARASSDRVTAFDCGKVGLTCAVGPSGDGTCGLGACDPGTVQPRCDGDLLVTCESQYGALVSDDCRLSGKTCRTDAAGTGACRSDVACDPFASSFRCEGSVEVQCEDGTEARQDCAMMGSDWTCATETYTSSDGSTTTSTMSCVPVAKECALDDSESCNAGVISYCNAGHPATFDCRSAGLSSCATKVSGSTTIAGCTR